MFLKVTRVEIKEVSEGAKTPVVIRGVVELDPGEDVGEFLRNNKEFVLVPYVRVDVDEVEK